MPPWPSLLDYQEALAFPQYAFRDPELAATEPATLGLFGLPQPITGNFTTVYRLRSKAQGEREWAVRLFLRDDPLRLRRYTLLASHVPLPSALLPFDYQHEGLALTTGAFPLLKLPWQEGVPLNVWVERNLNAPEALLALAARWAALMQELAVAELAHGDLQHGNIFVTPEGEVVLLDYDGLWTPRLASLAPPEQGHPSYQHPRRVYARGMDRFPALVIYVALRALAAAPELWWRLDNGDNLLFRREDFTGPDAARAFTLLRNVPEVRALVEALAAACSASPEQAPPLTRFT